MWLASDGYLFWPLKPSNMATGLVMRMYSIVEPFAKTKQRVYEYVLQLQLQCFWYVLQCF